MRVKLFTSIILALLLSVTAAHAQGTQTGIMRGTVTTADKLSMPGATVTIKSPSLQGGRTVVTESDGTFLFRNIPPGIYAVTFEMSGMQMVQKTVGGTSTVFWTICMPLISNVTA